MRAEIVLKHLPLSFPLGVNPVRGGHKPTVVALTGNNRLYIRILIFYIRLLIFSDTREQLTAERFFYILLL